MESLLVEEAAKGASPPVPPALALASAALQHFHSVPCNGTCPCSQLCYYVESECFLFALLVSWMEGTLPSW